MAKDGKGIKRIWYKVIIIENQTKLPPNCCRCQLHRLHFSVLISSHQFSSVLISSHQFSSVLISSHQFSSVLISSHDSRTFQVGKAAAQPIRTAGKISRGLHLHLRKLTCKECFKGVPHMGRIRKALENAHQSKQGFYMILAPHPTVAVLAPHPSMLVHCRTSK